MKSSETFSVSKDLNTNDIESNYLLKREVELSQLHIEQLKNSNLKVVIRISLLLGKYASKILEIVPSKLTRKINLFAKARMPERLYKFMLIALGVIKKDKFADHLWPAKFRNSSKLLANKGFGIKTSHQPLVSLIIPVHNNFTTTLTLLRKLSINNDAVPYEIIVVDDASSDDTAISLRNIRGINVLTHSENLGYLKATNSAIKYCKGRFIGLLNNDTLPENGWLDSLVRTMQEDSQIAIAGSLLLSSDGLVAEAGSQIFPNREIRNLGRWEERTNIIFKFTREVDYCSAAAILVDGEFLRFHNGFDERYIPAYFEDVDLAVTAWQEGRKVVFVHDSVVMHIEGVSHGRDTQKGLKSFQITNADKFWEKWGNQQILHWNSNTISRFEAKRESRGIVVFADNFVPNLQSNAGSVRAFQIIKEIQKLGFHVVVIPINSLVSIHDLEKLRRNGVEVYESYDQALKQLKVRIDRVTAFWVSRLDVAELLVPRIKRNFKGKKIIFDTVDLHHIRDQRNIEINGKNFAIYQSDIKKRELDMCSQADKIILVSQVEENYLHTFNEKWQTHVLFMNYDSNIETLNSEKNNTFVFVGDFKHTPNVDAVLWYIQEVIPFLESGIKDNFRFLIIGSDLPEYIQKMLIGTHLDYLGWQESLAEYYRSARALVAPIRFGAGKKGKIAEAISLNCPVVTTPIGAEGFSLVNGEDALIAESAMEFAQAISKIVNVPNLANDLAVRAKEKFSDFTIIQDFENSMLQILEVSRESI